MHAVIAGIVFQEFVNMANGLQSGRKLFWFFWKDTVGRKPIMEVQICHGLRKCRTYTAKQNRYSCLLYTSHLAVMLQHRFTGGPEALRVPHSFPIDPTQLTPGRSLSSPGLWIGLAIIGCAAIKGGSEFASP